MTLGFCNQMNKYFYLGSANDYQQREGFYAHAIM